MCDVSTEAEDILVQLVAWEMLGRDDLNPKELLRQLPLSELCLIQTNIRARPEIQESVSMQMVELEVQYRHNQLQGDWNYQRSGRCVRVSFVMTETDKEQELRA